jgi:transketolase
MTSADSLELAKAIRTHVLGQSKRANVCHIGSSLSIVDILGARYVGMLGTEGQGHEDRVRFVLSKGHAALALCCAVFATGGSVRNFVEAVWFERC